MNFISLQEIVWQIVNNVDLETSSKKLLIDRVHFLDLMILCPDDVDSVTKVENWPKGERRIIFSHLPFELLPPRLLDTAKVIHVAKNPKDVLVSLYHHEVLIEPFYGMNASFDDYAEMFIRGQTCFGSYFHMMRSAWERRFHPNLKTIWYEDMKRDIVPVIKDLCYFIGQPLTADKIRELEDAQGIKKFRERQVSSVDSEEQKEWYKKFVRKGQIGDWKNHFKVEFNERCDAWIKANMKDINIKIQYE